MARTLTLAWVAFWFVAAEAQAIYLQPRLAGLVAPVLVTNAGDGSHRLFVVELPGVIKVVPAGGVTPAVFLDIAWRVLDGGERGLLGLAFHPQYASNNRFFVHYTREPDGASVIAEYTDQGAPAATEVTERVLLTVAQPFANHNGGMIAFGPDGYLYVGLGDGGATNDPGGRAQNVDELLGKILRIDIDGTLPYENPTDNPFAGATSGRDEIFALGLRNPFRFSFDRDTGDLLVGDVGEGVREEITLVRRGDNLGWRRYEGTRCTNLDPTCSTTGLTMPIAEYSHTGGRCSVTGGYVYRGALDTLPSGTYVFADFCTGEIFALWNGTIHVLLDTSLNVSSLGEDESGELYVAGLGGTVHAITRARFAPASSSLPDLDGNGAADIIWRHRPTGGFALWLMASASPVSFSTFGVPAEWAMTATGDFNGDGRSDLLWRSRISGVTAIWLMAGHAMTVAGFVHVGPGWDVVGTGDVNGDGRDDVAWRNQTTGDVLFWLMNGTSIGRFGSTPAPADWHLAGLGDVTGDGTDDLVLRHVTTGAVLVQVLRNAQVVGAASFNMGTTATVVGVNDVDADGRADLLFWSPSGTLTAWLMQGATIGSIGQWGVSPDWRPAASGDLNGDSRADVFWHRAADRALAFWLLDGLGVIGATAFSVGPDWDPVEIP
jgi:hypothetical protein